MADSDAVSHGNVLFAEHSLWQLSSSSQPKATPAGAKMQSPKVRLGFWEVCVFIERDLLDLVASQALSKFAVFGRAVSAAM
jgi:hypothetical protein